MDRTKTAAARAKIEFGDFQTPRALADKIAQLLKRDGVAPKTIIEPTCGIGNFLLAAADVFPSADFVAGLDINVDYLRQLRQAVRSRADHARFRCVCANILSDQPPRVLLESPEPLLVIGNPPWVTNSAVGAIRGSNLPSKSNSSGLRGIEALTGQSNFDISEWIICKLVTALADRRATLAMLCKTSVARKVLGFIWNRHLSLDAAKLYSVDTLREFSASVDACLFVCEFGQGRQCAEADVYPSIDTTRASSTIGWRNGQLVADTKLFDRWRHLQLTDSIAQPTWRSGVKHDCAQILELEQHQGRYRNRNGESVDVEEARVFPLLKSADLANMNLASPRRWLLIPQERLTDDPAASAHSAPKTWRYLSRHIDYFRRRRSSIYRGRPDFSIFGIGDYTYAPYKVAISGFYKQLAFNVISSIGKQPIILDDTCYFLPCQTRNEAVRICHALNGDSAREFFTSFIFWDSKRPITAKLLRQLDIGKLLALQ